MVTTYYAEAAKRVPTTKEPIAAAVMKREDSVLDALVELVGAPVGSVNGLNLYLIPHTD